MMFRSFLLLPLSLTLTAAQIVFEMSVCYDASATHAEAQAYCESVSECDILAVGGSTDPCFKRCGDSLGSDSLPYDCAAEGLVCHHDLVCVLPPKMIEEVIVTDEFDET